MISAHVDDVLITAPEEHYEALYKIFETEFRLKRGPTLGAKWEKYLGRMWRRPTMDKVEVQIPQAYMKKAMTELGLQKCKSVTTPSILAGVQGNDLQLDEAMHETYRRVVGMLIWTLQERPDLSQSVTSCARACAQQTFADLERLKRGC